MESIAFLYLGLAIAFLIWFGWWTSRLAKQKRVVARSMLRYSMFCMFASVAVFGLASYGLQATNSTEEQHILSLFNVSSYSQLTEDQLASFQAVYLADADRPLLLRVFAIQTIAAFVKFFVPVVLAAIGVWALEKFLEQRITVVSE